MDYQISTDSCCDFAEEEYRRLGAVAVPLSVMWEGTSHSHFSTEAALKDFYGQTRRGLIATTSALNPDNRAQALAEILQQEYGIRNIHIGYIGPILGAHTGPGVLGLFHLGVAR